MAEGGPGFHLHKEGKQISSTAKASVHGARNKNSLPQGDHSPNKGITQVLMNKKLQHFTADVHPVIHRKVREMNKVDELKDLVEKQSGVTFSCTESSISIHAITSQQLKIAQECLNKFAKQTLNIIVLEQTLLNIVTVEYETIEKIENISKTEYLALLEIFSKCTKKFDIQFTHDKEALLIEGDLSEDMKKNIIDEIAALRMKQKVEITYEPQEKEQLLKAVTEAKSEQFLLVWDDDNKQVLVYSDNYEEVKKLKHKVEVKLGRIKVTGRKGNIFAKQEDAMSLPIEEETPTIKKFCWPQDARNVSLSYVSSTDDTTKVKRSSLSHDVPNIEEFQTLEGIVVKVYQANILRLDVDCIVNAANENLQHGGGVAWVIANGAGPEIDREGREILKTRGLIKVGEQCVTTAGNLSYKHIIHTVGPRWSDYYPHDARNIARCKIDLFNSIIGCFAEAEKLHLKSISLPAISSGIFAVPRDTCTEQYAKAVIEYSKTRTSRVLQEIHFIDMVPETVKDMQLAFRRYLSADGNAKQQVKGRDHTVIADPAQGDHGNGQHNEMPEQGIGATFLKADEEKHNLLPFWPQFEEREQKYIYRPNQNMEVKIYTADITKLKGVEVVVCPDDKRGNRQGAIAFALLQIGKSKYKNAKQKAFEKYVQFGDVVLTEGGDSNFHHVIHAVVPAHEDQIQPQTHKMFVQKCYDAILDDTNNFEKTSLALPIIGTGCVELGYEGSAELFLDSLELFLKQQETFNLNVIHIVDIDELRIQTVSDVFRRHTDRVRKHSFTTWESSHACNIGQQGDPRQVKPNSLASGAHSKEDCHICLTKVKSPKTLTCGHTFCVQCIESKLKTKPVCPECGAFSGPKYGDQPDGGEMKTSVLNFSLKGFEKSSTIRVEYLIPAGKQGPNQPEPGKSFSRLNEYAYLPDTDEGKKVCDLLKVAFRRRLIFTFKPNHDLGWSDIEHKTESSGRYGYPDPGYLKRVKEQLAAKGVTEDDITQEKMDSDVDIKSLICGSDFYNPEIDDDINSIICGSDSYNPEIDDDIKSIMCGSDSYDPNKDSVVKDITGPNLLREKSCVLKLLTTYVKSEGDKEEEDTFWHRFQCRFDFQAIWNFYNQTDCGRKIVDAILEKHHCLVSLAKEQPFKGSFVFQIMDQKFKKKSDVKKFMDVILTTVCQDANKELLLNKFTVDPRLHNDVLETVRQTKELDCVWIEFGAEQGQEICMVCQVEHKMIVTQRFSDIVKATEECFKNHEETVSVDLMWYRVMVNFGYLEKVNNTFPNLIINWDESNNVLVLKGPRDEARAAANTVLEVLGTAQHEITIVTFSPGCQLEIFSHPEMCDYINSVIPQVDVVWSLNHLTKNINVFAKDPKQLHAIDKVIKGCVKERFYPVLKNHVISSQTTSTSLEELKKKYTGRLVINVSASGLLVTTADDIYENVDAAIQEILSGEGGARQEGNNAVPSISEPVISVQYLIPEQKKVEEETN